MDFSESTSGASVMLCDTVGGQPFIRISCDDGLHGEAVLLLEVPEAMALKALLERALIRAMSRRAVVNG